MIGAFPPPIHGMSQVNAWMRDALRQHGVRVTVVDVSAPSSGYAARVRRFMKVVRGVASVLSRAVFGTPVTIYLSISGGWGQVYDVVFAGIARLRGRAPVLHHHSYAYLTTWRIVTAALIRVAGKKATHVVLCPDMERRLRERYTCHAVTLKVSNARLVEQSVESSPRPRQTVRTIGYLGNIAEDKGIREYLEVARTLEHAGHRIRALVAGPFRDPRLEARVRETMSTLEGVVYVGPKYDLAKTEFFEQIDVLVFPTKYLNEAEPLTVLEAMAHGVPVIAWGRGCLPGMIPLDGGMVIDTEAEFVGAASAQLETWIVAPDSFARAAEGASRGFHDRAASSREAYEQLLRGLGA